MVRKKGKSRAPASAERKSEFVGLRLEGEILDRLNRGGGSLSEKIRDRLKRTFNEDDLDASTRELRDALVKLAAKLRIDYANHEWHEFSPAHQAFVRAVILRLIEYAPPPSSAAAADLLGPAESPETIGAIRERDDRRENSYPQLEASQKRRSKQMTAGLARHMRAKKDDNNG